MAEAKPHIIVFANEKGGSGKSTTAVHVAVALASAGRRVSAIDLDSRQRTFARYMENRAATVKKRGVALPQPPVRVIAPGSAEAFEAELDEVSRDVEFVVIDTPGRDDAIAKAAIGRCDTLVTPINDSFVDFDLIGQVDSETFKVKRPSFYAEVVWDARKVRAKLDGGTVDWVVLRNRLQHIEARNMKRVAAALAELSKRVGFRVIPGLSERVIYRELFPQGLTLLDLAAIGAETGIGHIAARQELREMVAGLSLPEWTGAPARSAELVA